MTISERTKAIWNTMDEAERKRLAKATFTSPDGRRVHYCAPWCVEMHAKRPPRGFRPESKPAGDASHKPGGEQ